MIKSIVVHADRQSDSAQRLESALAIARRHGAHLTAHLNLPLQRFFGTDPFGGAYVVTDALALAQTQLAERKSGIEQDLASADVPWDVVATDVDIVTALSSVGALSDLVIVGAGTGEASESEYPMLAGDLVIASRVPVLAVPLEHGLIDLDGPVMVGWNGSAEAAAALRMARPLMAGRTVTLVRVGESDGQFPDTAALSYLSRHGIAAELREEPRGVETVEEALERIADAMGATLLVMGAYGHSRLRQTLFGGVTRHMLGKARLPLLLGH